MCVIDKPDKIILLCVVVDSLMEVRNPMMPYGECKTLYRIPKLGFFCEINIYIHFPNKCLHKKLRMIEC